MQHIGAGQIGNAAFPPFSVTQLRIRNGSSCPFPAIGRRYPDSSVGWEAVIRPRFYCLVPITNLRQALRWPPHQPQVTITAYAQPHPEVTRHRRAGPVKIR
jgi:hypothetical protein